MNWSLLHPGSLRAGLAVLFLAVLLSHIHAMRAMAQTATIMAQTGQTCAGTRFGNDLNCTSNDFSSVLTFDQPSAGAIANCAAGSTITVDIIAAITSNSPVRYDVAYFIGENAIDPRLNNAASSCSLGVIPTTPPPFQNSDGDSCGDYAASQTSTLRVNGVQLQCTPVPGTNSLAIPYVLVFNNQAGSTACTPATVTANTTAKCVSSVTTSVTGVTVNGYVTVTKQTLPDTQPQSFAFTATESGGATVTPASFNLSDNGSQRVEVPFTAAGGGRTLVITEALVAGWDTTSAITCTTPTGGAAPYVTVNNATRTITANLTTTNFGALCTITNTKRPTVTVQKTTLGGAYGPFSFTATNLTANPNAITTLAAGTPVTSSSGAVLVNTIGTEVRITEGHDVEYFLSSVSCTDQNSARTNSTGTFGTVSGDELTIPNTRIVAGADIRCTFTNTKSAPAVTLSKVSSVSAVSTAGSTITYTLTVTNTGNVVIPTMTLSDPIGTVVCAGTGNATLVNLGVGANAACTVNYTVPQSVFDNNGGGDGDIDNTAMVSGSLGTNNFSAQASHAVTLNRTPGLTILKEASPMANVSARDIITYTYTVTNSGNLTVNNVTLNDTHNGYGAAPVPGGEMIFNDAAPLGDSTDAAANASWDTLAPGDSIRFTATYEVVQSDVDFLQ